MNTALAKQIVELENTKELARKLYLALVNEIRYPGEPAESSLQALEDARKELDMCGCHWQDGVGFVIVSKCPYHDGEIE